MNTNITTTNSKSTIDNDGKHELYYEKLQFQLQMQQEKFDIEQKRFNAEKETQNEKFKVEQDRFNAEKEKFKVEQDKFQVKQDKFALEKQQFQHDMKSEKDIFVLEKEKFAIEKRKFEEQCQQHTNQVGHHNSLFTFSIIPQTVSSPMLPQQQHQQQHDHHQQQAEQQAEQHQQPEQEHSYNDTFTESNVLLNQHAILLDTVQDIIIDHGAQNAEIFDKAMRNLKRRAKVLAMKEADFIQRSEQLEPYEQHLEQFRMTIKSLQVENERLKEEFEPLKAVAATAQKEMIEKEKIQKERIAKQRPLLKSIFDTNVSSFGGKAELHYTLITIENLNKTIGIRFSPRKSLIETLWIDPETALFSILKSDWDNNKIPKVLDNTVKLFVSSPDVLIDGKEEWVQISGDGVESSLPPPHTTQITAQSLLKYTNSRPYTQTYDNDRCPQGKNCGKRKNPNCLYHCGSDYYNCAAAHQSTTQPYNAHYHIKLKWC